MSEKILTFGVVVIILAYNIVPRRHTPVYSGS